MANIHLTLDDQIVHEINKYLTQANDSWTNMSANDIAREALGVYRWIAQQTAEGKAVVAANRHLDALVQLSTPMIPAREPKV